MNGGADVLLQNTDSTAVLQAAERAGKYAFGWDSDMSAFAPKAHLGSAILNWDVYYEKAFRDALDGTWKVEETKWGVEKGMVDLIKPAEFLPAQAKEAVAAARSGLASGQRAVFVGPVVDSTGKERLPKGAVADDKWLGSVDFYVQGVEGKIPAGQ
jgi:simple sugar transport system substrate-binding protein